MDMLERLENLKPLILNMSANDVKLKNLYLSNVKWQQINALCERYLQKYVRKNYNLNNSH